MTSLFLEKRVRSFDEARRERVFTSVQPKLTALRHHIEQAETIAKRLSEEVGGDAEERASELADFIARDVIPDWLVPTETAVKEWLEEQEE